MPPLRCAGTPSPSSYSTPPLPSTFPPQYPQHMGCPSPPPPSLKGGRKKGEGEAAGHGEGEGEGYGGEGEAAAGYGGDEAAAECGGEGEAAAGYYRCDSPPEDEDAQYVYVRTLMPARITLPILPRARTAQACRWWMLRKQWRRRWRKTCAAPVYRLGWTWWRYGSTNAGCRAPASVDTTCVDWLHGLAACWGGVSW